jgi:hypothetical protein
VSLGRGSPVREPDLDQVHADLPGPAKGRAGPTFRASVPMYFHVVTDGATGSLTNAQIAAQMEVLNVTFAGGEGGARTGFSFRLAGVTRADNPDWFYAGPGGTNEHTMKRTLRQGGSNALNLYSTTAGLYLGWAYLPDILTRPGQAYLDGIVIDWESMPGTSTTYAGRYHQGETATREAGHWLNQEHTFYRDCGAKGDFVDDTPPKKTPHVGVPGGQGHLQSFGPGPDPQLHGLLLRLLLHRVHRRTDPAHARCLAAVPRRLNGQRGRIPAADACSTRPDRTGRAGVGYSRLAHGTCRHRREQLGTAACGNHPRAQLMCWFRVGSAPVGTALK